MNSEERLLSLKQDKFKNITTCIMYMLFHFPEMNHKQIAQEVRNIMHSSSTSHDNIKFYHYKLKTNQLSFDYYLDSTGEPLIKVKEDKVYDVPPITDEDINNANGLQKIALHFAKHRDDASFTKLYEMVKPGLTIYAKKYIYDDDIVADITSIALTKIYYNINQYNKLWNFSTWAYKIVHNIALKRLEKEKKLISLEPRLTTVTTEGNLLHYGADKDNVFEELSFGNEETEKEILKNIAENIIKDIQDLPEKYKNIIIDRELNGFSYKALEEKYEINLSTVKTRIARARDILQKKNKEYFKIRRF